MAMTEPAVVVAVAVALVALLAQEIRFGAGAVVGAAVVLIGTAVVLMPGHAQEIRRMVQTASRAERRGERLRGIVRASRVSDLERAFDRLEKFTEQQAAQVKVLRVS